jgi:hypothetical protein
MALQATYPIGNSSFDSLNRTSQTAKVTTKQATQLKLTKLLRLAKNN